MVYSICPHLKLFKNYLHNGKLSLKVFWENMQAQLDLHRAHLDVSSARPWERLWANSSGKPRPWRNCSWRKIIWEHRLCCLDSKPNWFSTNFRIGICVFFKPPYFWWGFRLEGFWKFRWIVSLSWWGTVELYSSTVVLLQDRVRTRVFFNTGHQQKTTWRPRVLNQSHTWSCSFCCCCCWCCCCSCCSICWCGCCCCGGVEDLKVHYICQLCSGAVGRFVVDWTFISFLWIVADLCFPTAAFVQFIPVVVRVRVAPSSHICHDIQEVVVEVVAVVLLGCPRKIVNG